MTGIVAGDDFPRSQPHAVALPSVDGFERRWKIGLLLLLGLLLLAVAASPWIIVSHWPPPSATSAVPSASGSPSSDPKGVANPGGNADDKVSFDKSSRVAIYGGDCRVKHTPVEVLLEFDPNTPDPAEPMKPRTRLVLTLFTAKRLLSALQTTLQRHEAVFGVVESPLQKSKEGGATDTTPAVIYANFCRVTATPEEVFLDFGLNENPFAEGPAKVKTEQVVILTFPRGKKVLTELDSAIRAHEAEFGVIELDVRKRAKNPPKP
jgi:hypothetical protein